MSERFPVLHTFQKVSCLTGTYCSLLTACGDLRNFVAGTGQVLAFCGESEGLGVSGNRSNVGFFNPRAVCRDPRNSNGYYVADRSTIRYYDDAKNEVTLIAGDKKMTRQDGIGFRGIQCRNRSDVNYIGWR